MQNFENKTITSCQRCGTCCKKGGPALHDEDKRLIETGDLPLTSLVTFRKGELVRENIKGGLIRLPSEFIKIKSRPESSVCMYFNDAESSCGIYSHRPLECRELECWNPVKIKAIYEQNRLNRQSVLVKISWLMEFVADHDAQCGLGKIQSLVDARAGGNTDATAELRQLINYDQHLRRLVTEKVSLQPETADFLFGRPLSDIITHQFGVKVTTRDHP